MDRLDRLGEAYRRAYAAGEELLKVLREPLTPAAIEQVEEQVNLRDAAAQEAAALFQPGDQVAFEGQLRALVEQQQALDAAMRRFKDELLRISQAAGQVRSHVQGARQMMGAGRRGTLLDKKR